MACSEECENHGCKYPHGPCEIEQEFPRIDDFENVYISPVQSRKCIAIHNPNCD